MQDVISKIIIIIILFQGYFLENPKDLKSLRHDKALHTVKLQSHLADVPTYLIPQSLVRVASISKSREHKRRKPYISSREHKYNKVSKVDYNVLTSSLKSNSFHMQRWIISKILLVNIYTLKLLLAIFLFIVQFANMLESNQPLLISMKSNDCNSI